jgi:hypothetical protein
VAVNVRDKNARHVVVAYHVTVHMLSDAMGDRHGLSDRIIKARFNRKRFVAVAQRQRA